MKILTANLITILTITGSTIAGTTLSGAVVGADQLMSAVTHKDYSETVYAGGNTGTSQTLAETNGNVQTWTMNGNCTFTMPSGSGLQAGTSLTLILTQDGTGSRHRGRWHHAGGGHVLQAPLDQILLGLVYRRRPEQPISALKHLVYQKQFGQPPESKPAIAPVACSAANLFSASCPTPRWRCAKTFAFGFAFPTS